VLTLLPLLTGEGRKHHGASLREAAKLVDAGKITPRIAPRRFTLETVGEAYRAIEAGLFEGKIVVDLG
jgi:NADPH2:quinone reductase